MPSHGLHVQDKYGESLCLTHLKRSDLHVVYYKDEMLATLLMRFESHAAIDYSSSSLEEEDE